MAKAKDTQALINALKKHYKTDVITAKGGFHVKGVGFVSLAKARQVTGIKSKQKRSQRKGDWGEYAVMRRIFGRM